MLAQSHTHRIHRELVVVVVDVRDGEEKVVAAGLVHGAVAWRSIYRGGKAKLASKQWNGVVLILMANLKND
jgi:hypothetical protein